MHCLGFAERAIRMNSHGSLAGIILEPITNASGARVYPPGYLQGMRALADSLGALLIFDEHATGLGRTGTMWAGDAEAVVPDVMYFGKYLGNGYPITVVAASERFRDALRAERQSSTHGGQPVACAAALATIEILERDKLAEHTARAGATCLHFMKDVASRRAIVGAAQGRGYQLAFEFVHPSTGQPLCRDMRSGLHCCDAGGRMSLARGACHARLADGVIQLSRTMARELGPYGVTVNCIAPGTLSTEMASTKCTREQVDEHRRLKAESNVLRRLGTPREVANATLFLVSDESSFISGQLRACGIESTSGARDGD
jgi:glutamate-1-semialdehyde aminotransferase